MFSPAKLALLASLALAACGVGEVPDGTGGTPDAAVVDPALEASFTATIAPLVTECVACHSTAVPQPPILTSFGSLDVRYRTKPGTANILVTKGDLTAGIHQGVPYFTEAEKTTVANWIEGLP